VFEKPPARAESVSAQALQPASESLAVLVVGMHRSGTSALSGVLNLLGVDLPRDLHPADEHNERGYFEGQVYIDFHERVLARIGWPSDDPLPLGDGWLRSPVAAAATEELADLLEHEFAGRPYVLFKDPRMCRLLPVWRRALADLGRPAVALLPFRHPLEVVSSLARKAETPRPHGLMLWLTYVVAAERATRGMPRAFLDYDSLMASWRDAAGRLGETLGLVWPRAAERAAPEIDRFLAQELRHQRSTRQTLSRHGIEGLCAQAWEALQALEQNPDDAAAQATLETLAARVAEPLELLAPLVVADRQRFANRTQEYHDAVWERDSLARKLAQREEILAGKDAHIEAVLEDRARAVAERDQTILQIAGERDRMSAEQQAAHAAHEEALAALERAHAGERAEAARRAEAVRREATELAAALEHERATRAALLSSTSWRATAPLRAVMGILRGRRRGAAQEPPPRTALAPATTAVASRAAAPRAATPANPQAAQRVVYVSGEPDTPGHLYRVARAAAGAHLCGAQVTCLRMDEIAARLDVIRRADILYLWRTPFTGEVPAAVDAARAAGAKVVFDVDDKIIDT
jgi:hypothetical protein